MSSGESHAARWPEALILLVAALTACSAASTGHAGGAPARSTTGTQCLPHPLRPAIAYALNAATSSGDAGTRQPVPRRRADLRCRVRDHRRVHPRPHRLARVHPRHHRHDQRQTGTRRVVLAAVRGPRLQGRGALPAAPSLARARVHPRDVAAEREVCRQRSGLRRQPHPVGAHRGPACVRRGQNQPHDRDQRRQGRAPNADLARLQQPPDLPRAPKS